MTFHDRYSLVANLPVEQFRQLGIACCYRLGCDRKDKRLAKALKMLEQSLGSPVDEKLLRDARNAASSTYPGAVVSESIRSASLTLYYACWDVPTNRLIYSFRNALVGAEGFSTAKAREVERALLSQFKFDNPSDKVKIEKIDRPPVKKHSPRQVWRGFSSRHISRDF